MNIDEINQFLDNLHEDIENGNMNTDVLSVIELIKRKINLEETIKDECKFVVNFKYTFSGSKNGGMIITKYVTANTQNNAIEKAQNTFTKYEKERCSLMHLDDADAIIIDGYNKLTMRLER